MITLQMKNIPVKNYNQKKLSSASIHLIILINQRVPGLFTYYRIHHRAEGASDAKAKLVLQMIIQEQ